MEQEEYKSILEEMREDYARENLIFEKINHIKFKEELCLIAKSRQIKRYEKTGFVYLIKGDKRVTKIGMTLRCPFERLKEISNNTWKDYEITHIYPTGYPGGTEKVLHHLFDYFKIKGEWFSLSSEEIVRQTKRRDPWNGINWWNMCEETCKSLKIGTYSKTFDLDALVG
jgi:hypothetical protein